VLSSRCQACGLGVPDNILMLMRVGGGRNAVGLL